MRVAGSRGSGLKNSVHLVTPGHARSDAVLAGDAPVIDDRSQDGLAGNVRYAAHSEAVYFV
jgi:hypothetical protein